MSQSPSPEVRPGNILLPPLAGLGLGLAAALLAWVLIQRVHPVFLMPENLHLSMGAPAAQVNAYRAKQRELDRHHAMLYLGSLGAFLGALLGVAEGRLRRSILPIATTLPLGALGGVAGGLLACLVQEQVRVNVGLAEIKHTVMAQLALCLPLAGCIGLGLGLATRSLRGLVLAVLAGLAAGVLAGVLYPLITSTFLPGISTDSLLPEEASSRLMWLGLLAGVIGLVVPIAGRRRKSATSNA